MTLGFSLKKEVSDIAKTCSYNLVLIIVDNTENNVVLFSLFQVNFLWCSFIDKRLPVGVCHKLSLEIKSNGFFCGFAYLLYSVYVFLLMSRRGNFHMSYI